ncbi:hypothetical protein N431DRAFT_428131 [Stipitochalara longipes BDJ]|nr:hypothetical protein N431DRAFT_428131 [Stipitochalara longipes BDJ]
MGSSAINSNVRGEDSGFEDQQLRGSANLDSEEDEWHESMNDGEEVDEYEDDDRDYSL